MMRSLQTVSYILLSWIRILSGYTTSSFVINHKVFLAQFDTIKNLAAKESCVIVGRCADYALADYPNTTTVFINANMDDRIKRICKLYEKDPKKQKILSLKQIKREQTITIIIPVRSGEMREVTIYV